MIPVDLVNTTIISSPLKSGFNVTNLLIFDFNKDPICIVTLPLNPSWILLDFGHTISGVSQVRLHADSYLENSGELLSNIEIQLSKHISPLILKNYEAMELRDFIRCGNTGTVSKYTSNIVVDCESSVNARWVLIRRQGQLSLCYVQILQSSVKPECFQKLSPPSPLYQLALQTLTVFRFKKHVTYLKCLQNCDYDYQCVAVTFVTLSHGTGTCQMLRSKSTSQGTFNCRGTCKLRINQCHLGNRLEIYGFEAERMFKFSSVTENLYALSVEINGLLSCYMDNCEMKSIFMVDQHGQVHDCGTIDPNQYRLLSNAVFMCNKPILSPTHITIKTDSHGAATIYRIESFRVRLAEKESFSFRFLHPENVITSTLSTKATSIAHVSFTRTSSRKRLITTERFISSMQHLRPSNKIQTEPTINSLISSTTYKRIETSQTPSSTEDIRINTSIERTSNNSVLTKHQKYFAFTTTFTSELQIEERIKEKTKEVEQILISPTTNNQSNSDNSRNNSFAIESHPADRQSTPLSILLIFGGILILVTIIAITTTFFDVNRRKKPWNIPEGGLCPLNNNDNVETTLPATVNRES